MTSDYIITLIIYIYYIIIYAVTLIIYCLMYSRVKYVVSVFQVVPRITVLALALKKDRCDVSAQPEKDSGQRNDPFKGQSNNNNCTPSTSGNNGANTQYNQLQHFGHKTKQMFISYHFTPKNIESFTE